MTDVSMDPAGFDADLAVLGWGDAELSRRLGCARSLPGKWRKTRRMPAPVREWVRNSAAAIAAHPPPAWPIRKNTARTSETEPTHDHVTSA